MPLLHTPLHVHTEYSLLDGASKIPDLVSRAKELELPAISITDHGVMYGCYELLQECLKQGIKPILGSEVYIINGDHTDKKTRVPLYHLVLLAKNDIGYQNLCKICSEASINGFYYKPRISKEYLKDHSEGLVCATACLGGEIPNLLSREQYDEAKSSALWYQEVFGEDFYLEIQDHGIPEEALVAHQMTRLSKEINVKVIATNDSHFTRDTDAIAQDAILCIQTMKYISDFPRMHFSGSEFLKTGTELNNIFDCITDRKFLHTAIEDNTMEITNKIGNYDLLTNTFNRIPEAPVPANETNESYLRKISYEYAHQKYGDLQDRPDVVQRLEYELKVIEDKGFAGYFLIVADFIRFARESLIPVGPGRGSAAGSILAYVLSITNIDPLKYNLLFERFLNPERESMPDIDTDFCIERRNEVLEYVKKIYGDDKVAQIITFNKLTSKAVLKDVARVLQHPYKHADELAKMIPVVRGKPRKLDWMTQHHPEFKESYAKDDNVKEIVDLAQNIEGTNKSYGVHAAGVIISDVPLTDITPLAKSKDGTGIVTQYSMDHCASLGLLKMDFLGLRNLTVIHEALGYIKQTTGDIIDIDNIDLEDQKTYKLLGSGELTGVFQLETSAGMRQVARDMQPSNIEEIAALIALYRPGPLDTGMIDEYIARKAGKKAITYDAPELEPILKDSFGTIVYQEQIMQIAQHLAGFSLGEADLLRRAMGKKKPEEMELYRGKFTDGCNANNIDSKVSKNLFDLMMSFAEYCFNKSHAAAYAFISYQTAWLKANYPVQYLAALMNSVGTAGDKVRYYITEARRMNIEVLIPDINISGFGFTPDPDNQEIRFGLGMIKNVSSNAVHEILQARSKQPNKIFQSLQDLCSNVDLKIVSRKSLECLIQSGSFAKLNQQFNITRKGLLDSLDSHISQGNKMALGQTDLFGTLISSESDEDSANSNNKLLESFQHISEFTETELGQFERNLLGFYVTSHPLQQYSQYLKYFSTHSLDNIDNFKEDEDIAITVLLDEFNKRMTKSNKLMATGIGEDLYGKIELVFFSSTLEKYNYCLQSDTKLLIKGKIQLRNETDRTIIVNEARPLDNLQYLHITLKDNNYPDTSGIINLRDKLIQYQGNSPVILKIKDQELLLNSKLWICNSDDLINNLKSNYNWIENIKFHTVM